MKSIRLLSATVLAGCLLGAVLILGADPIVSSAEAGRRHTTYDKHHSKVIRHHQKAVRHHRKVVRRHRPVRYYRPRHVYVRHHRPWYVDARRVYIYDSPFYFNAGLNVYLGGVSLGFQFGNAPPAGYVYADPYCDLEFYSVNAYHAHLNHYAHRPILRAVPVGWHGN